MRKPIGMIVAAQPLKGRKIGDKRYTAEQPPIVIGIDPGTSCGIAWQIGSQPMQVATKNLLDTMLTIATFVQAHGVARVQIWIEDARQNKPVFDRGTSRAAAQRIAQNVGAVKRDTDLLEQHCKRLGVSPVMVRPTTAKWTPAMMRAATGIERCSQHARDAAKLIAGRVAR